MKFSEFVLESKSPKDAVKSVIHYLGCFMEYSKDMDKLASKNRWGGHTWEFDEFDADSGDVKEVVDQTYDYWDSKYYEDVDNRTVKEMMFLARDAQTVIEFCLKTMKQNNLNWLETSTKIKDAQEFVQKNLKAFKEKLKHL